MEELIESEELATFEQAEALYEQDMISAKHLKDSSAIMKKQVSGTHYKKIPSHIQPWAIIDMYGLNFYEGCALKYLLREKTNRIEDLQKLLHYIEKEISNLQFKADKP